MYFSSPNSALVAKIEELKTAGSWSVVGQTEALLWLQTLASRTSSRRAALALMAVTKSCGTGIAGEQNLSSLALVASPADFLEFPSIGMTKALAILDFLRFFLSPSASDVDTAGRGGSCPEAPLDEALAMVGSTPAWAEAAGQDTDRWFEANTPPGRTILRKAMIGLRAVSLALTHPISSKKHVAILCETGLLQRLSAVVAGTGAALVPNLGVSKARALGAVLATGELIPHLLDLPGNPAPTSGYLGLRIWALLDARGALPPTELDAASIRAELVRISLQEGFDALEFLERVEAFIEIPCFSRAALALIKEATIEDLSTLPKLGPAKARQLKAIACQPGLGAAPPEDLEYLISTAADLDRILVALINHATRGTDRVSGILRRRIGFRCGQSSLEDLAREHQCSRERIRQLEDAGLSWIRRCLVPLPGVDLSGPDFFAVENYPLIREGVLERVGTPMAEDCLQKEILGILAKVGIHFEERLLVPGAANEPGDESLADMVHQVFLEHHPPLGPPEIQQVLIRDHGVEEGWARHYLDAMFARGVIETIAGTGVLPTNKTIRAQFLARPHARGLHWTSLRAVVDATYGVRNDLPYQPHWIQGNPWLYLSARGTYRHIAWMPAHPLEAVELLELMRRTLLEKGIERTHLSVAARLLPAWAACDRYQIRWYLKMFGEDAQIFLDGQSSVDEVTLDPDTASGYGRGGLARIVAVLEAQSEPLNRERVIKEAALADSTADMLLSKVVAGGRAINLGRSRFCSVAHSRSQPEHDWVDSYLGDLDAAAWNRITIERVKELAERVFGRSIPFTWIRSMVRAFARDRNLDQPPDRVVPGK